MPTTAIGIWAYCSCENTASSAPYFWIMLLIAAIAATREICDKKLVMPSVRKRFISPPQSPKLARESRIAFMCARYHSDSAAVRICPMTVATAAPIMPILSGKIKIGSSTMFVTAPATVATMAKRGLPSERMMGFIACPNI